MNCFVLGFCSFSGTGTAVQESTALNELNLSVEEVGQATQVCDVSECCVFDEEGID